MRGKWRIKFISYFVHYKVVTTNVRMFYYAAQHALASIAPVQVRRFAIKVSSVQKKEAKHERP